MGDDLQRQIGLVSALQRIRGQYKVAKATIAERDARIRAAQLALIDKHGWTVSAVCDIFDSPKGPL
jgi:predicted HNH restriction endonuclease